MMLSVPLSLTLVKATFEQNKDQINVFKKRSLLSLE